MTIQGRQSMECCRMWNWRAKGKIEDIACREGRPATYTACKAVMRGEPWRPSLLTVNHFKDPLMTFFRMFKII
jgi:hypothetical protein